MDRLNVFLNKIDTVSKWSGNCVAFLILPGIFIICWEVVMRYVFDDPTRWVMETSRFILLISMMALAAYTLREKRHVRSDIITSRLPNKWQESLDIVASVTGIIYCGICKYGFTPYHEGQMNTEFLDFLAQQFIKYNFSAVIGKV